MPHHQIERKTLAESEEEEEEEIRDGDKREPATNKWCTWKGAWGGGDDGHFQG